MSATEIAQAVERLTGRRPAGASPLSGGSLSSVWRVEIPGGEPLIAKTGPGLQREAGMLSAIRASGAPAPNVVAVTDGLLLMSALPAGGAADWPGLGGAMATLHACTGERFGWHEDHAFASVEIPNRESDDWVSFWRDRRLLEPAAALDPAFRSRLEQLSGDLENRLPARPVPALLHGDLWGGNVVFGAGGISGFIDPACYFGHAEVDIAMLRLFDSPPCELFDAYGGLEPGADERLPIYQLWPAIVHVRLFGSGYHGLLDRLLAALGV